MNQYRMMQQQNHAYRLQQQQQQQMQIQNQQQSNQQQMMVSNPQQGFPQTQSSPIGVLNIPLNTIITIFFKLLFRISLRSCAFIIKLMEFH